MGPASNSIDYSVPKLPILLSTASFIYLLRVTEHVSDLITNTHLLGSLLLGILWGSPHVGNLLNAPILQTFTLLGYVGLILIVFAAGLTTPLELLLDRSNLLLSTLVALTGIALPFALTFGLLYGAYGYTILQAFGAGAALCSTSLGTTISLLDNDMKRQRVGVVLMTAALADDVVGLVIAGIVANLGSGTGQSIHWSTIVRPVLVSLAFTLLTPVGAVAFKWVLGRLSFPQGCRSLTLKAKTWCRVGSSELYLFITIATLVAFVAGSHTAGTSELYGAYLAGTFLSYTFEPQVKAAPTSPPPTHALDHTTPGSGLDAISSKDPVSGAMSTHDSIRTMQDHPIGSAFDKFIHPILTTLLSPLFFASIGASLPVQNLFTIHVPAEGGSSAAVSHAVVWKGIVYSLLMIVAKVGTGVWMLVWPDERSKVLNENSHRNSAESGGSGELLGTADSVPTSAIKRRFPQAIFLGLAMVARGEIALIIAQLARPLLTPDGEGNEEAFAVVIWAILLTTVCGALGVGVVLRKLGGSLMA